MHPDIEDGIFIWRLICLLRLILSCILWGCEMYISVHQITAVMAVSQRSKICVLLCLCERMGGRQWGEMASMIRFVCSSFVFCSSVGQWITVCVCISCTIDFNVHFLLNFCTEMHGIQGMVRDMFGLMWKCKALKKEHPHLCVSESSTLLSL